ncbi:hypothetical protein F53441_8998 [Fusarium austroafricanum]|uniref:Uncharacterized protein n=1 Tax=Fusarium austroafricanum TaxID=2364996 RepID=A0A8H4KCW6_9HYPO|nr:hypothetical protein F53441_8998 [Fusarium austroafricanum]
MDSIDMDDCPGLEYSQHEHRPECRPEHQCPYCAFYPHHEEQKLCEVCQSQLSQKEAKAFLDGEERDWSKYHLIRQGQLTGRDALENVLRARLVREKRCRRLCCAKTRPYAYVHCKDCRGILQNHGASPELTDKEEDEMSMFTMVSRLALLGYSAASYAARVARGEAHLLDGWSWGGSSGKFVHSDHRRYQENASPERLNRGGLVEAIEELGSSVAVSGEAQVSH